MCAVVNIGAYNDITGESCLFQTEVIAREGESIELEKKLLLEQLNTNNGVILYYLFDENEQINNSIDKKTVLSGGRKFFDKGDNL